LYPDLSDVLSRQQLLFGRAFEASLLLGRHFRQTEIQNLRVPAFRDKDVRRFNITVDNTFRVRRVQRIRNFDRNSW
jgi:hypothetical protein